MADGEGRCELAIAPGQVYIEVEYDYEYKSKRGLISIHEGECFMLVKKTNEDWWQVRKDEDSKAFYVPAQYVREVRKALMPPPKALLPPGLSKPKPQFLDIRRPGHPLLPHPETPRDASQTPDSPGQDRPEDHYAPRPSSSAPPDPPCDSSGSSEKLRNDSESGDELSSSSTELLQVRAESPICVNLQEMKVSAPSLPPQPCAPPLSTLGDWETHTDASGRHFYFNPATQECTWKPPRARDASSLSRGETHTPGETEWLRHVDKQGRPYYYSADGSRSEWELPKYPLSPGQLPDPPPKTRSLDRREPFAPKWRHNTCILEANEKPVKHRRFRSERLPSSPTYQEQESPSGPKPSPPDSDSCPSSPKSPSSPSEKSGFLNVTKITERGRKVRKNWTSSWTLLRGSSLQCTKGQAAGSSWFGHSQPEFSMDLRGGSVEWASKDKSSKKHVIELKTRQGTELLIHSENESVVNDWYKALAEAITAHAWESDEAIEEDMPESPGPDGPDEEKEHHDSKKSRAMKNSADSSEHKRTRGKLKKLLTRRPTLQAVKDKGYIKDQVFGGSLASLCQRENVTVPKFVKMCIDHVENNGLGVDGLYRVSGNLAVIQKLRFAVNHDEKVNLEDGKWEDIHVTTGALKMFFRELPEPLFTYGYFDDFISAIKCFDKKQRLHLVKDLIRQLPKPNHDTMQALFKHLRKVVDHGEENRMTPQSLAIVFGPTLLRPEIESFSMAVHMVYQNHLVELVLLEYEHLFGR